MDKNARGKTLALSFFLFLESSAFGASGVFKEFSNSAPPAPAEVNLSFPLDSSQNLSLPNLNDAKALVDPVSKIPKIKKRGSLFRRFFDGFKYPGSLLPQGLPKPLDLPPALSEAMDLGADSSPKSVVRRNLWDGEDAEANLKV